jgi:uncharacterized membrane protein
VNHAQQRADLFGNRLVDAITRFAGSMTFVYLHVISFGCWIGFGVEYYPCISKSVRLGDCGVISASTAALLL